MKGQSVNAAPRYNTAPLCFVFAQYPSLLVPVYCVCRFLRPLQAVDYYIPGDDPHHRHQSPSPIRERRSSRSRSRDSTTPSGAFSSAAIKQPSFGEAIEEEREEKAEGEAGEEADEASRQGEPEQDGAPAAVTEPPQEEEEDEEQSAPEQSSGSAVSSRRKSTRSKRGDGESTRAKLRRKTTEIVDSAAQLLTGKRRTRGRKQQAHANGDDTAEANGAENEGEESASEQPGRGAQPEEDEDREEDGENSQPEGTPAKSRRRSSRSTSQSSRSPLRALARMLPSSVKARLSAVGENGEQASGDRDSNHRQQHSEPETSEVAAEGKAEDRLASASTSSLFDWRWLLPGLLVALFASLALVQLFQPHLLPWSASSSYSSSVLPLQEADWHRISSSFLPSKDWQSFKQRWERWTEDDKRRADEIVTAVKEWVDAKLHKIEHRKTSDAAGDVSELRAEMSNKLSAARAEWLREVGDLVEQRVVSSMGDEAKARHAEVQRVAAELRSEMEQRVAHELQRGTDELLDSVRQELQQRLEQQSEGSEERTAQWQSRLKDDVAAVERRAVDAALAVVDERFVSSEQLKAVDDDIRRYIQATLAAQAEQYATADELKQLESRVMTAVQQRTDQQQQQQPQSGGELTEDDKRQLIAEVMEAVRGGWEAEKKKMKAELHTSLLKDTTETVVKEQSGAINELKQQLAELKQRLGSSQSKEGKVDSSTRQWVEERVQSVLDDLRSAESMQQREEVMSKLSAVEAALDELRAGTTSTTASTSPSSSSSAAPSDASVRAAVSDILFKHASTVYSSLSPSVLSDITAALERFAADRTNEVDYALASSGGRIVAHSPTHSAVLSSSSVVSPLLSLFTSRHLPEVPAEAMLDADMSVGHCWPMQRQRGGVIIGLRERVRISGLSLQHASVNVLPDGGASMPRMVRLTGVDDDQLDEAKRQVREGEGIGEASQQSGTMLGQFEYEREGSQVQHWSISGKGQGKGGRGYQYVRLDVLSNYGNSNYTCIYRVRVHGEPVKAQ